MRASADEKKERLPHWSFRDYLKNGVMLLSKLPLWLLQLCLFFLPLKKNRIAVYSLKQHGYSCNLKALTESLLRERPDAYEICWIVRREEDLAALQARGIPAVMLHSFAHVRYRFRAGIVITNDEFYPAFRRRRGQRYINTWHGGINYKKIGYAGLAFDNPLQKLIYRMNNPCPDLFVSGSRSFTETASEAFGFPRSVFAEIGLPRNDLLCRPADPDRVAEIKASLGLSAPDRIVLYAPTFRGGNRPPQGIENAEGLLSCLKERFGGTWRLLVRQHYFVAADPAASSCVTDVSDYEDMQELLLISDVLISDYSSCMWDFLLTERPCFVYAEDLDGYETGDRSFFVPPSLWPYPIAQSADELYRKIAAFDAEAYRERCAAHRQQMRSFDTGHACSALADRLSVTS